MLSVAVFGRARIVGTVVAVVLNIAFIFLDVLLVYNETVARPGSAGPHGTFFVSPLTGNYIILTLAVVSTVIFFAVYSSAILIKRKRLNH